MLLEEIKNLPKLDISDSNFDKFRYYQCTQNLSGNYICTKINYNNYENKYNSKILFINKNLPENLDKHILKYKLTPEVFIK